MQIALVRKLMCFALVVATPGLAVAGPDLGMAVNAMLMMLLCWIPIVAVVVYTTGRLILPREQRTGTFFYMSLLTAGVGGPMLASALPRAVGTSTLVGVITSTIGAALISSGLFALARKLS